MQRHPWLTKPAHVSTLISHPPPAHDLWVPASLTSDCPSRWSSVLPLNSVTVPSGGSALWKFSRMAYLSRGLRGEATMASLGLTHSLAFTPLFALSCLGSCSLLLTFAPSHSLIPHFSPPLSLVPFLFQIVAFCFHSYVHACVHKHMHICIYLNLESVY